MTKLSTLFINQLELTLHLGWPENEILKKQTVLLDIEIQFAKPPIACISDQLDDTICYSKLIQAIRDHILPKHFHLIEHLSHSIYQLIKPMASDPSKIIIHITKHPKIPAYTGSVRFSYGDTTSA